MNRRLIIVAVFGLGLGLAAQAFGQTSIAPTIKSTSTLTDQDRTAVKKFIDIQVTRLTGTDVVKQSEGREALINEVQGTPSAQFLDTYCQLLNEAMLKLAADPQLRVRLNAAVATARVADKADNIRLEPSAVKFLNDKSTMVTLWGVKAAKALMPAAMRQATPAQDPMLKALAAGIADDLSGPTTQEAYEALSLGIFSDAKSRKDLTQPMLLAVIPEVQKVLALRIDKYRQGTPSDPETDTFAAKFLTDTMVWNAAPALQGRTAQLLGDLLTLASHRTADFVESKVPAEVASDPKKKAAAILEIRDHKNQVIQVLKYVSKSLWVVGDNVKSDAMKNASVPVAELNVSVDAKSIAAVCDDLVKATRTAFPAMTKTELPAATTAPEPKK